MTTTITPIAQYPPYPVTGVPEAGELAKAADLKSLLQNIFDRVEYLKQDTDQTDVEITDLGVIDGDLQSQITANSAVISANVTKIQNIDNNVGGNVSGVMDAWDDPKNFDLGDSYKVAIEKVDQVVDSNKTSLESISPTVSDHQNNIESLAGKLSPDALDNNPGMSLDSGQFLEDSMTVEDALLRMDIVASANRRFNNQVFVQTVKNWIGADGYTYDSLYDDSKINVANSTASAYDIYKQAFYKATSSWVYYSNVISVPSGTNRIKMNWNGVGTLTVSVNLQGSFTTSFAAIASQDTWVAVTPGTQLVVKIVGTSSTELHNYMVGHKIV